MKKYPFLLICFVILVSGSITSCVTPKQLAYFQGDSKHEFQFDSRTYQIIPIALSTLTVIATVVSLALR